MLSVDIKELSPRNRDLRARRLCKLKRLLERHDYLIDPEQIARDIILDAYPDDDSRQLAD
jgi:hypothetical protein